MKVNPSASFSILASTGTSALSAGSARTMFPIVATVFSSAVVSGGAVEEVHAAIHREAARSKDDFFISGEIDNIIPEGEGHDAIHRTLEIGRWSRDCSVGNRSAAPYGGRDQAG